MAAPLAHQAPRDLRVSSLRATPVARPHSTAGSEVRHPERDEPHHDRGGLLAAPFFLSASPYWQVAGALLFLAHSILDGCDGELARLKFLESRRGARLDFWGDNIVHCVVFACFAAGWSTHIAARWPLALGALVVGSTLAAAALLQPSASGPPIATWAPAVSRGLVDALSNRNFIYLIILLAVTGRAWWFLAPAAIGTPVFVGLALWTRRARPLVGVSHDCEGGRGIAPDATYCDSSSLQRY